jgi:hypothetical protein
VFIPSGTPNNLVLTTTETINELHIASGATITISSANILNVKGDFGNGGTFNGSGRIRMNGSFFQYVYTDGGTYGNFEIDNPWNVEMPVSGTFVGTTTFTNGRLRILQLTSNPIQYKTVTFSGPMVEVVWSD